jgi:hypothetical protein
MKKYKKSTAKADLIDICEVLKIKEDMGKLGEKYAMWKDKGYKVVKGSKSFKFWSKPIKAKKKEAEGEETKETKYKFFNVAHVFTSEQVEKL